MKLDRKLKILEERYSNLNKKAEIIEKNMLNSSQDMKTEIKLIEEDISEIKHNMVKLTENINLAMKEFQLSAKKNDLQLIKSYLEYWQPLKLATEDFIKNTVRDILNETNPVDTKEIAKEIKIIQDENKEKKSYKKSLKEKKLEEELSNLEKSL